MNLERQKAFFNSGKTRDYLFRKEQLKVLYQAIETHEETLLLALEKDLNKSAYEAYMTEIGFVKKSISYTLKQLKKWMKTRRVKTPYYQLFTTSFIQPEPLGTVLIIGAYNYPVQLLIEPLIGAIAAGNTAILKPSEQAVHTEQALVDMIQSSFDEDYVKIVTGDAKITSELLDLKFDHIFFTGSSRVGQIVYEKAAKQLIPVTLELGGKSPAIVTKHAHLKHSAKRIAFGKLINAGQSCIAPDYVYVEEAIEKEFMHELHKAMNKFSDPDGNHGSMITDKHFQRLVNLMATHPSGKDSHKNHEKRIISPVILQESSWEDEAMQAEIFGPILPVLTFKNISEMIDVLKQKEKPLALYLFSDDKKEQSLIFSSISFGGGAINDTIMHIANPNLPFGGVGQSGIGTYHGYQSFKTFSHMKGYTKKGFKLDLPFTYPPASDKKLKTVKKFLK